MPLTLAFAAVLPKKWEPPKDWVLWNLASKVMESLTESGRHLA